MGGRNGSAYRAMLTDMLIVNRTIGRGEGGETYVNTWHLSEAFVYARCLSASVLSIISILIRLPHAPDTQTYLHWQSDQSTREPRWNIKESDRVCGFDPNWAIMFMTSLMGSFNWTILYHIFYLYNLVFSGFVQFVPFIYITIHFITIYLWFSF